MQFNKLTAGASCFVAGAALEYFTGRTKIKHYNEHGRIVRQEYSYDYNRGTGLVIGSVITVLILI